MPAPPPEPAPTSSTGGSRRQRPVQHIDELRRFRMVVAGVCCATANASLYLFTSFTEHIRNEYGFDQKDITHITTFADCFGFFTLPAGFLYDYAGPSAVFAVSGILGCAGYLFLGLAFSGYFIASVGCITLFNIIFSIGFSALDGTTLMTLMLNFPLDTGAMVIIQKIFSSLGTSVLVAFYHAWLRDNYSSFAYLIAAHMVFCSTVAAVFIRYPPYYLSIRDQRRVPAERQAVLKATQQLYLRQRAPVRRLVIGYVLGTACLVFLTVQSITMAYTKPAINPRPAFIVLSVFTVVLVALFSLMAMPFQCLGRYVPVRSSGIAGVGYALGPVGPVRPAEIIEQVADVTVEAESTERAKEEWEMGPRPLPPPDEDEVWVGEPLAEEFAEPATAEGIERKSGASEGGASVDAPPEHSPLPQYTASFWQNLLTPELWCMWLFFFGIIGTNSVVVNNAAQLYRAVNYGEFVEATNSIHITMMSIGNAIGRVSAGCFDMWLTARQRQGKTTLRTTVLLPLPPLLCTMGYVMFLALPAKVLILTLALAFVGNGAAWGLFLMSIRMMYARDLGKHYTFCYSAGIVSTIALNRYMFGELYDREAHRRGTYPACNDPACVYAPVCAFVAAGLLGVFATTFVAYRFQRFTTRFLALREQCTVRNARWPAEDGEVDVGVLQGGQYHVASDRAPRCRTGRRASEDSIFVDSDG